MPISEKIRKLVDNAWTDGYCCLLATAGENGPNISPKGSLLVYDDDHLAYWERSKKQALANLGHDKRVVVIYANMAAQRDKVLESGFLRFYGKVVFHESGPLKEKVFSMLLPREQTHDGADTGMAAVVKIERAVNARGQPIM